MRDQLVKAIHEKQLHLSVLGAGYVGLPTAALFADAGFFVTAVDLKPKIIKAVNNGKSPIAEPNLENMISRNIQAGRLKAVFNSDMSFVNSDAIIISVQTPINESNEPDLSFLIRAIEIIGKELKKGSIVVICSTIPPKTMHTKIKPLLENLSDMSVENDFFLAYVPERIAPGRALKELVESPRLIGGIGPRSTEIATELFRTVCNKVLETDAQTAEISKLAENTFRDVNIAFANQLALICEKMGVDVKKVITLANTHPRVNIHMSGPGVGGPCLTKDPYLLINEIADQNKRIITLAREINDYMPHHMVELTLNALKLSDKNIEHCRVTILGTSYKAGVDDSRISPSQPIIQQLIRLGAMVLTFDPYCTETFGGERTKSVFEAVKQSDCLIIITDHNEFRKLYLPDIKSLMNVKPAIIDGKRIINPIDAEKLGFIYFGIGYGK